MSAMENPDLLLTAPDWAALRAAFAGRLREMVSLSIECPKRYTACANRSVMSGCTLGV